MKTKTKARAPRQHNLAASHYTISEAAIELSKDAMKHGERPYRYQRMRDLVLTGACGEPFVTQDNRIYVPRAGLLKYVQHLHMLREQRQAK